jgi:hypothetical protein
VDRRALRPDISFVRGLRTAGEYAGDPDGAFSAVTSELQERGWIASPAVKRYLVYYEAPAEDSNICGTAFPTLGSGLARVPVVCLGADPGRGARDLGTPATGAVPVDLEPGSADVMFPFVTFPLRDKLLDRGRDGYSEHPFLHRDMPGSPFLEAS